MKFIGRQASRSGRNLRVFALIVILLMVTAPVAAYFANADAERPAVSGSQADVYVSPSGTDNSHGTPSRPLHTLLRARDVVRRLLTHSTGDVTVHLAT